MVKHPCPFCDQTLTYELGKADESPNDQGGSTFTVSAQTDGPSTAHVHSHKPGLSSAWLEGMNHTLAWLGVKRFADVMGKDNPYGRGE